MIGTSDVHAFPELEERIGENPAVFLTRVNKEPVALAVIRGIETGERARAWKAVERRLAGVHDRKPRPKILDALDEVEDQARFETVDDRRDYLSSIELDRTDQSEEIEEVVLWRHEPCGSLDVEQESRMAWFCHKCDQRTNRVEAVDPDDISLDDLPDAQAQLAIADGGRKEGSR